MFQLQFGQHPAGGLLMRVIAGIFVSVCVLFHSQPAVADGIGGWPLLHWGMSRQQVERAYPNFEDWDQPNPFTNSGWIKRFGLRTYLVGGCTFSVYLDFLDNRLERIQLDAYPQKKGKEGFQDQACRSVKDTLSEKYGQFTINKNDIDPSAPTLEWKSGETEISFMAASPPGDVSWISVVYMNKREWLELLSKRGKDRL
ncbi:MAG: hypothetical protein WAV38_16960 [Xanthobacteraceae bacterium]